ncbi:MAG TPA: DUF3119 family protein [Leptolyngbyaceae cyanobacterium M65_K2018_010]|nr:DUF3119 family protein [Leptolyngbyaceae cyanobacterium M65_K2018_010]
MTLNPANSTPTTSTPQTTTTELAPSYRIPLGLVALALPLFFLQIWLAGVVGVFGVFLLVQALTLRLHFTDSALEIYRGNTLIRHFPYAEWQYWQIFWAPVPILFYFREIKSIHFLPILFSPTQLRTCLETHCPNPVETP